MTTNSAAFVSGAAGTRESYVLRMLERHYRLENYKVFKLAPTGVAAHNISGQTLHRFFGMTNQFAVPNYVTLEQYVQLYPKIMLLIDEYSVISAQLLSKINDALVKTTQRCSIMGGIKIIFFGDIGQLPPVQKKESTMWISEIYNSINRYNLNKSIRPKDDYFVDILNKVRLCIFDRSVIEFINSRTVAKSKLPPYCLRLYTTRGRVRHANKDDCDSFEGEGYTIKAYDHYIGVERTARIALKETRLFETLYLKLNMPVMLIQNLNVSQGWVNGSLALIEYIDEENICLKKQVYIDDVPTDKIYWTQRITRQVPGTSYTRSQYPIVPVLASTIHKCQSATIDCIGIHLDDMSTHGQLYVATSQVRRIEDLYFFGADLPLTLKRKFGADADAIEIIRKKYVIK